MAISETDIANISLAGIGQEDPIDNLWTDDSKNARLCRRFFWPTVDALLRGHLWNCAIHRRTITPLAAAPDSDWDYQYQLPVNPYCLRMLQVGEAADQPIEWRIEGRRLLCNESSTPIVYIKRITDTNEFDPLLVDALAVSLSIKLAMPITNNPNLVDSLIKQLEMITLPLARTIDGQEGSTQSIIADTWENSRY